MVIFAPAGIQNLQRNGRRIALRIDDDRQRADSMHVDGMLDRTASRNLAAWQNRRAVP
jgi:hypothetical protein